MKFLAVNPWVHDFACYDFYAKPYGLAALACSLIRNGHDVIFIDLMSPVEYDEQYAAPRRSDGTGAIYRTEIAPEAVYKDIRRPYYRFGLPEDRFRALLQSIDEPDAVLVSSMMTYWYPGVRDTIAVLKTVYKKAVCYLGGIYASLMPRHATEHTSADHVVSGDGFGLLDSLTGGTWRSDQNDYFPDFSLFYNKLRYLPVLTSRGCPFNCAYCSSRVLNDVTELLPAGKCISHIHEQLEKTGVDTIAFYDDALLFRKEYHLFPILKALAKRRPLVQCYTPNGLHVRFIDERCACLMKEAGFSKIRISLEFFNDQTSSELGPKVSIREFRKAVNALQKAGFTREQIGVYILAGLRGQTSASVREAIDGVYDAGGIPYLSEYSPVPGSAMFESDCKHSIFDLSEPLWHNNSVFPMQSTQFSYMDFRDLKNYNRTKR